MKRILCGVLAAAALTASAGAYQVPNAGLMDNVIWHENINSDAQAQAEFLQKLGLFAGTDKGFELGRAMTRAEAAAMLCRFLGGAAEAESGGFSHPFNDVPAWASNPVGWLYQNKLTYGVSAKQYGASQPVTAQQFAAFLSRALTGEDDMVGQLLTESEALNLKDRPFLRSYAVAMAVRALPMQCYRDGVSNMRPLAKKLAEQGVFTAEQFVEAAWDVLPPSLDGDICTIADIPRARCSEEGLTAVWESVHSAQPYYYATREAAGTLEIWKVDWETMQAAQLDQFPALGASSSFTYLGTIRGTGKDYLTELNAEVPTGRLFSISGDAAAIELTEAEIGKSYLDEIPTTGESFSFKTENGSCVIDSTGVHLREAQAGQDTNGETTVLYTGQVSYVTQTVTSSETTVQSIRNDTGEVLASYTVQQDLEGQERTVSRTHSGFGGEAGYYAYDEDTGTLTQVFDIAVNDTTTNRYRSQVFYLAHEPGKRIYGMNSPGGDTIILIDPNGERLTLVDASAGIPIAGFTDFDVSDGRSCEFFSASDVGMQHFDIYTYFYDGYSKKIRVTDFEAGRPEVMNGFDYDHPEAYKAAYIAAEQARIDEAWNSRH